MKNDMSIIEEEEVFEFPQELPYEDELRFETQSEKNQKTLRFLINKYGPDITLEEALERYKDEDGEDLDRTYYDSCPDSYDYENRPLKITDIQYNLQASHQEVEEMIETMKQTDSSVMLFVPYYEDGKRDPDYYEGLVNIRYLTRHILDHDFQYDAPKWGYYNGVFRFVLFSDDLLKFLPYFYHRLNMKMPGNIKEKIEA